MSLQSVTAPAQYHDQDIVKVLKGRKETVVRVSPLNKTSGYKPGENMKIRVSDAGYVDWSTAYFTYKIKCRTTNSAANTGLPTTAQVSPCAESIFRKINTTTGNGSVVEDWDHRDVLSAGMNRHTMGKSALSSERSVVGNISSGNVVPAAPASNWTAFSGRKVQRAAAAGAGGFVDATLGPFSTTANHLGFFGSKNLYPMKYMGQLLFDCDFVSDKALLEPYVTATGAGAMNIVGADGGAGQGNMLESATIDEIELVYTSYQFGDEFDALVQEQINSEEGMNLLYDTFVSHVDQSTTSGELVSKINLSSSSLKGIYTLIRPVATIEQNVPDADNGAVAGSFQYGYLGGHNYRFGYEKLDAHDDRYNYQVSNRLYPSFNAKVAMHAYPELLKSLSRFGDVSTGSLVSSRLGSDLSSYEGGPNIATLAGIESGSFMLGVNLEQQTGDNMKSGVDTRGNLDVSLKLNRTSDVDIQLNHFSHVDRIMKVMPNNEVQIIH